MESIRKVICGTYCRASRNIPSTASTNYYPGMSRRNSANVHLALPNKIPILLLDVLRLTLTVKLIRHEFLRRLRLHLPTRVASVRHRSERVEIRSKIELQQLVDTMLVAFHAHIRCELEFGHGDASGVHINLLLS